MKKIFIFFLTILLSYYLTVLLSSPVYAQDAPPAENYVDNDYASGITSALGSGEMNAPAYASHMQTNFMSDGIRRILGPVPGVTITADAYQNNPRLVAQMRQGSAVTGFSNYIAMMYANPPADLALWIRDTGQTLGFIPRQANAQGIGFSGLAPLLPLWKAFRNIAYLIMALVMIVIGFMIMLRKKIDPKTVVTVQNALPKIVITLILITFSYAIAGLLIDFMYLVMFLIISLLVNSSQGVLGPDTLNKYLTGGFRVAFFGLFGGGMSAVDDIVRMFFYPDPNNIGNILKNFILNLFSGGFYFLAQYTLVGLIVAIAVLFGFVRIIFMLVSAYIQIIIAVLVGPLQILAEAIPGSTSFSSWFKNLISNLAVFPITAGMLLIGTILTQFENISDSRIWAPPLISQGSGPRGIAGLIGLGVLLTIPSVVNAIKEALKAKGAPVGIGAALGPIGSGIGQATQLGYQIMFVREGLRKKGTTPYDASRNALSKGPDVAIGGGSES